MLEIRRLSSSAFAAYGHVASPGDGAVKSIRDGRVLLSKPAVGFAHSAQAVDHAVDFYDIEPETSRVTMVQAERHEHSCQAFIPMAVESYLVAVWRDHPASGVRPELFVGGPRDVVIYNPGIWHHGMMALGGRSLFASTMWRTRGGVDVEFIQLPAAIELDVADVTP